MSCRAHAGRGRREKGFTLVELVVVISVASIVAALATNFITRPVEAYRDLRSRAALVDAAESALRRVSRDVHAALPNSLRVSPDGRSLELLHTADGARYRRGPGTNPSGPDHSAASDWLDFLGDAQFNVLGRFANLAFAYGTPLPAATRLAVYNTSPAVYAEAAAGSDPGVITPAGTTITLTDDTDEDQVALSAPFRFRFTSPRQRLHVVDTPVSHLCALGAGTLTRYSGYPIASVQPTDPGASPLDVATAGLLADRIASCRFAYDPGTPTRAGLLTAELVLADGDERVRLLQQVHVDNLP